MPIELHISSEEPPTEKLKLALVGKEKSGKSWLASTGRKWVLNHDFDNRAESLQGKPGHICISYVEPQWPKQPEAAQLFLDVLAKLEETSDLYDIIEFLRTKKVNIKGNVPRNSIVRTNVIDSIQTMGKAFQNYALFGSSNIRREITFAGYKVFLPGGWDAWNSEMVPVENNVLRLLALPSDTIIVLHETDEEAPGSTSEKPIYTGRKGIFPVRYQRLIKYFNEVWRVRLTPVQGPNNKLSYLPRVFPQPNAEFDSATAMYIDAIEEPSIEALIAKHEKKYASLPKAKQELPVPASLPPAALEQKNTQQIERKN